MANNNWLDPESNEIDLTGTLRGILPKTGEWGYLTAKVKLDANGLVEYDDVKVTTATLAPNFTVSLALLDEGDQ